jgi:hypothetical protein
MKYQNIKNLITIKFFKMDLKWIKMDCLDSLSGPSLPGLPRLPLFLAAFFEHEVTKDV